MSEGAHTRPRKRGSVLGVLRTVATLALIPVCVLSGLVVLAFSRSRRRAANHTIAAWTQLASKVVGLRVVVENEVQLNEAGPAVVIFNHASAADVLIMCSVLKANFTGVAKKEIRRHPFLGPGFAFVGAVFIDRFDREQAVKALQPAVETLRSGISIAVAPEGTRSRTGRLGEFKKGAFRLAMAAHVPIVPIIIHNARDALAPGGVSFSPATIRVTIAPAIPTHEWLLEELDAKIAEVRKLYLDARDVSRPNR